MKRIFMICLIALAIFALPGCIGQEYHSKASYFDGKILAEYDQLGTRSTDDTFTLHFYAPGHYDVAFSKTPGKNDWGAEYMPQNFSTNVLFPPRVRVISQDILPGFLRVTITRNGVSETHDFK